MTSATLPRALWATVASFLSLGDHLTRFAVVCSLWASAAQSPCSWGRRSFPRDRLEALLVCFQSNDLFKIVHKLGARLNGRVPSPDICRLVDKYHFGTSVISSYPSICASASTLYLVNGLAKSVTCPVEYASLSPMVVSSAFGDEWNVMTRLPQLHTVAIASWAVPPWRRQKLCLGSVELQPMRHVTDLILERCYVGPQDCVELCKILQALPVLQAIHWPDASLVQRAGAVSMHARFLVEIGHVPLSFQGELAQCWRLEKLTLAADEGRVPAVLADCGDWSTQWPKLAYLELIDLVLDHESQMLKLLANLAHLPANFKTLCLRTPRNVYVFDGWLCIMITTVKQASGTLPFQRLCLCLHNARTKAAFTHIEHHGIEVVMLNQT